MAQQKIAQVWTTVETAVRDAWRKVTETDILARVDAATETAACLKGASKERAASLLSWVQATTCVSRSEVYKWLAVVAHVGRDAVVAYCGSEYPALPVAVLQRIASDCGKPGRMSGPDVLRALQDDAKARGTKWSKDAAGPALDALVDVEGLRKRAAAVLAYLKPLLTVDDAKSKEQATVTTETLTAALQDMAPDQTYGPEHVLAVWRLTYNVEQMQEAEAARKRQQAAQDAAQAPQGAAPGGEHTPPAQAGQDAALESVSKDLDATKTALARTRHTLEVLAQAAYAHGVCGTVDVDALMAAVEQGEKFRTKTPRGKRLGQVQEQINAQAA